MDWQKYRNPDGQLTAYALACGYVQVHHAGAKDVSLYHKHECYFVDVWDNKDKTRRDIFAGRKLEQARKAWKQAIAKAEGRN